MCGIFGYLNFLRPVLRKDLVNLLLHGLVRLEYRGYDSAGICFDGPDGLPHIVKTSGNVSKLSELIGCSVKFADGDTVSSHVGIAHTRWATHGEPTPINSHPHRSDPDNQFVIVHNGIITNYKELKDMLMSHGYVFESQTDTEAFAKLLLYVYNSLKEKKAVVSCLADVVRVAMSQMRGTYAILVKSTHFPNELVAIRNGSPLIMGARASDPASPSREFFFASDAAAIVEHTKQVMYLQDYDLVHIVNGVMRIYNLKNSAEGVLPAELSADRVWSQITEELQSIMKGGYPYFMQKEIFEQKESAANTFRGRLDAESAKVKLGGVEGRERDILSSRRVTLLACGTSYHSGLATQTVFEELTNLPVYVELASEYVDRKPQVSRNDFFIVVSQSGETIDTLRALRYVKARGALVCGITNTVGSSIARETDFGIYLNAGIEIGVASTKAYTSQVVAIILLALHLSEDSLKLQPRRNAIIAGLRALSATIEETLKLDRPIQDELTVLLKSAKHILVCGRGTQLCTALEGALKIKEISYIHSEGFSASELRHGAIFLVQEKTPVIVVCTHDGQYDNMLDTLRILREKKATTIAICQTGDERVKTLADYCIGVPATVDCLQPIVNVIPLQLLSFHLAVALGRNVDQPRNLAKAVVV